MSKTFIVAELSANHGHKLEVALESVRAAKEAGADAVKIQTYTADTITLNCEADDFKVKGTLWNGRTLYDLYQEAYTPWEWHQAIFDEAQKCGITCFSTPFDKTAVDFLEELDNPIYKIASFEITDIPLIRYIASKQKPIILSTGIAMEEDIRLALDTIYAEGNKDVTLLKCTSAYPAPIEDANLLTIPDMKTRFGCKVGLSDHSEGYTVPMTAVALGAEVVEKHFILDRSIGGPDAAFSMEIGEFAKMVQDVRNIEKALGSVYLITEMNVRSVRPGFGLHPKYLSKLIGKSFNRSINKGSRLLMEYLD